MNATQEQIVSSAAELIWQRGYHNTSVDQIIQAAGVCKGNFYYYFPSKNSLGLAVIDAWARQYEEDLVRPVLSEERPPVERIEAFIDATVESQAQSGYVGCPLGRLALEMGDLDESFRNRLDQAFDRWRGELAAVLARAGVDDPRDFAQFLLAAMQGAFLLTKVEHDGEVLDSIAGQLKELLRGRIPETDP